MKTEQIIILVVAFFLGMLLLNVVKNVCGCEVNEGFTGVDVNNYINQIQCTPTLTDNQKQNITNSLQGCGKTRVRKRVHHTPLYEEDGSLILDNALSIFTDSACGNAAAIITNNCSNCNNVPSDLSIQDPTNWTDQQKQWLVGGCQINSNGDFPSSQTQSGVSSGATIDVSQEFAESLAGDDWLTINSDCWISQEEINTYPAAAAFAAAFRESTAATLGIPAESITIDGISTDDDNEPGCSGSTR